MINLIYNVNEVMILPIILLALGLISLTLFCVSKVKGYSYRTVIIKGITSLFFLSLGIYGLIAMGFRTLSFFVVPGLFLGLLGDIFLDLKYVQRDRDYMWTMLGFIVFGLGHILYVTGMFLEFYVDQSIFYIIIPILLAIIMGPVTMLLGKAMKAVYGKFFWIAFFYAMTLFATVFTSFFLWMMTAFTETTLLLFFIGGVLFAASDLILNMTYFTEGHEKPFDIVSNSVTYYIAQFLIALCILFI